MATTNDSFFRSKCIGMGHSLPETVRRAYCTSFVMHRLPLSILQRFAFLQNSAIAKIMYPERSVLGKEFRTDTEGTNKYDRWFSAAILGMEMLRLIRNVTSELWPIIGLFELRHGDCHCSVMRWRIWSSCNHEYIHSSIICTEGEW